jgi:outer membrane protein OmpA-like peptidoglycan-associated protein
VLFRSSTYFPFGLFVAGGIDIFPFAPELAILPVVEAGIRFPRGKFKKSSSPAYAKNKEPPATNTGDPKDDLIGQNITASTTTIVPDPADTAAIVPQPVEPVAIIPQPTAPEVTAAPPETPVIVPPPVAVAPVVPTIVEPTPEEYAPAEVIPEESATIVPTPAAPEVAVIPAEPPAILSPPVAVAPVVPTIVEPTPEEHIPAEVIPEEPTIVLPPAAPEAAAVPSEPAVIAPPPVAVVATPTEPAIVPSPVPPPSVVSPPVQPPEPTAASVVTQAQRAPIQGITGASQAQNISVILEDGRQGILNSIYFEPDTAVLIELYRSVLNGVGRRLAEDPSLELVIRAYAAYFGTADGRHTVSSDRAVFSRDYLATEYGISVNRFSTEVYGADRSPKYATEDWQTHRCVELILVRK